MPERGFLDRFKNLEIPEGTAGVDWTFLDAPLALPPLPLEEAVLLFIVDKRALVPESAKGDVVAPPLPEGDRVVFHSTWHALQEVAHLDRIEAGWQREHAKALAAARKRFWDMVPSAIVRDPSLVERAREVLVSRRAEQSAAPGGVGLLGSLLGKSARIARMKDKLFDLVPLREYVGIFEKAIEPALLAELRALPPSVAPEEMLRIIEGALDQVHAKARSPLRNKMLTCRTVVEDVTFLPLYREPAEGLFAAYRLLVERELKIEVLSSRGQGGA